MTTPLTLESLNQSLDRNYYPITRTNDQYDDDGHWVARVHCIDKTAGLDDQWVQIAGQLREIFGLHESFDVDVCEENVGRRNSFAFNRHRQLSLGNNPVAIAISKDNQYGLREWRANGSKGRWQDNQKPYEWFVSPLAETADGFRILSHHQYNYGVGRTAFTVRIPGLDQPVVVLTDMEVAQRSFGFEITDELNVRWAHSGNECDFTDVWKPILRECDDGPWHNRRKTPFNWTFKHLKEIKLSLGFNAQNMDRFLRAIAKEWPHTDVKMSGISKTWKKISSLIENVKLVDPLAFCALRSIAAESNRSIDGVKVSVIFNEMFKGVDPEADNATEEVLRLGQAFWKGGQKTEPENDWDNFKYDPNDEWLANFDTAFKNTPYFLDKRKQVLRRQGNRAFTLLTREVENLGVDEKKYPVTAKAIKNGEIPLGCFFRKSEQYFVFNDNYALWEGMLRKHKDVALEIAEEAASRTKYEKDLMSYFYFVLHRLPKFLKRHTKEKWTCVPRLVKDANELEAPEADENGVVRQRSALTPHVDNQNKVVSVPYAHLRVPGAFTQYCYGLDFNVLSEGQSFNGNVVTTELEKKLNGKDDYGLMYYTLTGSASAQGYPTFLIIFERLQNGTTRVHFHRTHPFRSKQGDYNPIHNWIKGCYNWMAGNVPFKDIIQQQGDLMFVRHDKKVEYTTEVNEYDSHRFNAPVRFAEPNKSADKNILGFMATDVDMPLKHLEHDAVVIPAGEYQIRQCRSWEANPRGIWSLNID